MRLTMPNSDRQLGSVSIMQQIDVVELESRSAPPTMIQTSPTSPELTPARVSQETVSFSNQALESVLAKMVIIVPCKDESQTTIRSVLCGIPADCAVILVSNCADGYGSLSDMLKTVCMYGRQAILVHQKYHGAAAAFKAVGIPQLLDSQSPEVERIRDGKGEGMYLGIAMARTFFSEKEYVGFVDADNQIPGSVNEYCRVYAAGFKISHDYRDYAAEEQVMVRISWKCKPKVRDGQISYDEPEGRSSRVVNAWLNRLFAKPFGDDSKFITTGNAGEHAMTMSMALSSRWANGYAIETYQFMDPFLRPMDYSASIDSIRIRIFQIGTLNPHLHRQGDDMHILRMWAAGLGAIWHNLTKGTVIPGIDPTTIEEIRSEMAEYARQEGGIALEEDLPKPRVYPAMDHVDFDLFKRLILHQRYVGGFGAPEFFGVNN
ncbi:mannosyl-3-phosphoglycerate synthase [Podospora fimiseda]|uniref:Mannosyl-3-phosphoglycerate synthase n=1 Tax=Podospora fimiseda TaxID=252190 RepID=A0AAN7GZH8_9PEZI|nr:mannosyl-3-phosphoglycerate synthase [Podospora fimiseda]